MSLLVSGCLFAITATAPSIGTIKSPGEFRVDGTTIHGNSTIFDGNVIETEMSRSVIELTGAQITLSRQSRVKVFRDRLVLETGGGLVRNAGKHTIEVATLRIAPASNDSVLQIDMSGPTHIAVSSQSGSADVRNSGGVLIASLRTGMALAFDPQAGAAAAATVTGTLHVKGTTFVLTDTTANITFELRGDLAKYANKTVRVTGSIMGSAVAAAGASQVIHVTSIDVVSSGKKAAAAGTPGAGGGTGTAGAAAGGLSTGATVAIVAGVGVAGGVAGLALTGNLSGDSPVSRQ
jgi:hypothetical protein